MAIFRAATRLVRNLQIGGLPATGTRSHGNCPPEHPVYDVLEVI